MRNALGLLLFLASTASAADLPRYWTVHIDYAADRAAYERVEKEFSTTRRDFYAAHSAAPAPVIQFSAPDGVYYGLRPRGTFTDFDKPNPLGDAMKELQAKPHPLPAAPQTRKNINKPDIAKPTPPHDSIHPPKHTKTTNDANPGNDQPGKEKV